MSRTLSTRFLLACMLALGVLLLLPSMASALVPKDGGPAPGTETRITTSPYNDTWPRISGNLISFTRVYQWFGGGDEQKADVYYYDLATGRETQVSSGGGGDFELGGVSDGRIVYTDYGQADTMLYDVGSGTTTDLTPGVGASFEPCIGGDLVAWSGADRSPGQYAYCIHARDLATGETRQLSTDPDMADDPATDGKTIVWVSELSMDGSPYTYNGDSAVLAYDWASGTTKTLASTPRTVYMRPDVSGNRVVFSAAPLIGIGSGYDPWNTDIYCYDLATDTVRHLELPGIQRDARISGDYVSFSDVELVNGLPEWHVCVWDLASDTVYRIPTPVASQFLSDIDGHRIAYLDMRDGWDPQQGGGNQLDIYSYEFDVRPPTLTVTSPAQGAVYTKFDKPTADWSAVDDYSGIAASGDIASGQPLDMTPGTHTVTFWATDGFGNRSSVDRTYTVKDVGLTLFPAPGATLPFGDVTVGQAVPQIVTATNSGEVPLWVTAATVGASAFSVSGGGVLLNPGQTADLTVRFAPTTTGVMTGALHVEGCDASTHVAYPLGLADIVLSGRGVSAELPPVQAAQKLLVDFNTALANGTLVGSGPGGSAAGRANALRNMIEATGDYLARGDYATARTQLTDVIARCDGLAKPPDFVSGPARQSICDEATALLHAIGG